jgi:hypothetical protein
MKKAIVSLGVFSLTFLIGYFIVPNFLTKVDEPRIVESELKAEPIIEPSIENSVTPIVNSKTRKTGKIDKEAEVTYQERNGIRFKIQLLETGEFWSDEINSKSGETWLGLFNDGNNYFLKSTKINVQRDSEKGKTVTVPGKNEPLFLVKNATKLKRGKIETIVAPDTDGREINMQNGFSKDFNFRGETYSLRVESDTRNDEGSLDNNSRLVLRKGEKTQVLATLKNGCDDCFWSLYWVGDLDQDGKLDFYLDLSNHYNAMAKMLFLSSEADKGKLVKRVAEFWTVGC